MDDKSQLGLAKDAGLKYIVLTSKHHEDFVSRITSNTGINSRTVAGRISLIIGEMKNYIGILLDMYII